jgi:hypothetical protein
VSYSKYSGAVSFLVLLPMVLTGQRRQESLVPLRNWATPLYWQPNQAERQAATTGITPQLQFSTNAVSTNALTFVAITPCRLVDTRGAADGFNGIAPFSGPSIPAAGTITIPVQSAAEAVANTSPAPCGVIPSIAQAYSFNVTVVPAGGGSVAYLSLWPAGSPQPIVATLNDLQGSIVANAAIVPAGTSNGAVSVFNSGPAATDVIIDMNGYFTAPTDLNDDTAIGLGALARNTTGSYNTAFGEAAENANTSGSENTATGFQALANNTTGSSNTAVGFEALIGNTIGGSNIAIGFDAAQNVAGANSNNIHIGNLGANADNAVIRIGNLGTQTSFYVAGVRGVTTGATNAVNVMVDANGQLGTISSSRRFKEDIQDMGDASSGLMRLRPVTFRYKRPYEDGSKPIDYGLIAEEVAEVYPDLAVKGADGQIETVQYQKLVPMLLNEVQKQAEQIRLLEERLAAVEAMLSDK